MSQTLRVYPPEEAAAVLARDLPHWRVESGFIVRRFRTNGFKGALIVANAVGHLAEAAWHHPDLFVAWGKVEARLQTHDAGGITDKDFELARKIEECVQWRPAGGAPAESAAVVYD